nr:transcription antitermination factor NusB [Mesorhizobium silamurunense]
MDAGQANGRRQGRFRRARGADHDRAEREIRSPIVSEPAHTGAVRHANKRGAARLAAVQALYQMDVAGSGVFEITAEYEAFRLGKEVDGALYREADAQWFRAILTGVVENQKTIDPVIRQALTDDWPLSRLDSTLRAILRAGVYELMKRDDVPVAVIVSEYVDIAKAFYEEDEPKLVNAVLDRVSRRVRGEGRGKDAS